MPTFEDNQISRQILSDFENMARTNTSFNRPIERYQRHSDWTDGHVEIGTLWRRHNVTLIYLTGNLNESEKNIFEDIAFKLKRSYNRPVELTIVPPVINTETNVSGVNAR